MPDHPSLTAVEWLVDHHSARGAIAIVRRLELGPRREVFYRVVSFAEPAERELVGYWSTPDEAARGAIAWFEEEGRGFSDAWLGTSGSTSRERAVAPPQKPGARPAQARSA